MFKKAFLGISLLSIIFVLAVFLWPETSYEPYKVDAAYQAQVDAFYLPDMPPDWKWGSYSAQDGTRLRWGETGNRFATKASIILVPGYTATLDMYGEHMDALARDGFHVIGFDLRGQGGSERHRAAHPEKLWVKDFRDYSDDLAGFIRQQNFAEDHILILAGISFGGHVTTRVVGDHDLSIDGLYLIAPALQPMSAPYTFEQAKRMMAVSRIFGKAKHYVYGQNDWRPDGTDFTLGSNCSSNPSRLYYRDVVFTRKPEQRVGGVTNQWGAEFFESSEYVLEPGYLEKITVPVTIISAAHDDFVVTDINSQACSDRFSDCRELKIPETGHCLLQESDAVLEQIYQEIHGLFKRGGG